ncbi:WD repeat-containing protein 26 [Coccidioides immitis H538.4]|uniref:Protein FYV10 n=1 Tax=Coccidioides immitis H538.4 TaxID=396776 RepID=A0A0J8U7Q5_COCIT|nr:WD repeat-containing protein 26 [Coccidioides immitis H538.4]
MKPDGGASASSTNGFSPASNGTGSSPFRKSITSNAISGRSSNSYSQAQPQTNGSTEPSLPRTYYGHDREEVTRILIQSLYDLGYSEAAATLSRESKYELESPAVAALRTSVLEGQWLEAETILLSSFFEGVENVADGRHAVGQPRHQGLVLAEGADRNEMLFSLRQQKFLELLENRDLAAAFMRLRQERSPVVNDITEAAGRVVESPADLKGVESISPSVMIPGHRLATLLDQVKQNQINRCLYHNTAEPPSLYSNHMCDRSQFPTQVTLELNQHTNEVWYLEFSHDGTKLATTSSDRSVIIYDTRTFGVIHKLTDHGGPVAFATWSPDDTKLISCSQDCKARLWDVETGRCLLTIDHHREPVTSAAWAPDSESFVTCSLDNKSQLCLWSVHGDPLYTWAGSSRIRDCAISPDGRRLIAISTDRRIHVYNFPTREEEYSMRLDLDLTCINISSDSRYMLVNMSEGEVQLLDIETKDVVRQYSGQKQGNFIIRSTFGGAAENFVVSGSEGLDSRIYIWHKENCMLVETLEGHAKGCVNAVAWNPKDPGVFASAGDDRKVKIWTNGHTTIPTTKSYVSSNGSTRSSAVGLTISRSSSTR